MRITMLPYILLFSILLFVSCEEQSQLSSSQREEIIQSVEQMAKKFLQKLDAKQTDEAMDSIDSSAVFYFIAFGGSIKITKEDIAATYETEISFKSKWNYINIDPLTVNMAFFQGSFNQVADDSTIENVDGKVVVSAVVLLRDYNWRFFKGQIYSEHIKDE